MGDGNTREAQETPYTTKKSIRKIYNLRYRDHTLKYFWTNKILQVPELLEFSTLTYIQSGIQDTTPTHVRALGQIQQSNRDNLRSHNIRLSHPVTGRQYINYLPPVWQAKLFNCTKLDEIQKPSQYR